ncbi:MAG TPA: 23S rRNA (pseudouridine(1915)-N(3))-methyltransferase RlmH, partial [Rhizomicrobium sp.]
GGIPRATLNRLAVAVTRRHDSFADPKLQDVLDQIELRAHVVLLDAKGKGMTSEDFSEMLGSLRDVGTKDIAFVIGGPDGLKALPGQKAGRSLAFGPQTWPHLLARVLLLEQIYRAMTILAGHPYHRA